MIEDYVSFEIAKLMKEKGFNWPCLHYWQEEISEFCIQKGIHRWSTGEIPNSVASPYRFSAPTFQMAMKWLREKHSIDISVTPDRKAGYSVLIFKDKRLPFDTLDSCSVYEQACEAAIKYCIENLI